MRRLVGMAGVLLLAVMTTAFGHPGHGDANQQDDVKSAPNFFFDAADRTAEATVEGNPLFYDADLAWFDGHHWFAWLEFAPGKGDRIWIGQAGDEGGIEASQLVSDAFGEFAAPTLTACADGLWLSYEALNGKQWDVYRRRIKPDAPAGEAVVFSHSPGTDVHHAACCGPQGKLVVVWQSAREGQFDVLASIDGKVSVVGNMARGDWHPRDCGRKGWPPLSGVGRL